MTEEGKRRHPDKYFSLFAPYLIDNVYLCRDKTWTAMPENVFSLHLPEPFLQRASNSIDFKGNEIKHIMAKHSLWKDEYWLMLMQLYLRKPEGVKPLYSRGMVELALELHIPPRYLYEQMFKLRQLETPRMEKLWERYGNSPRRLAKGVQLLREMKGFNNADAFYEGVETVESWETDFKPMENFDGLMPVALIMILDLYFRLTPNTMVEETPEIQELAKTLKLKAKKIVEIMDAYRIYDPYLNKGKMMVSNPLDPYRKIWQRFGNDNPEKLSSLAAQLKEFFK